MRVAGPRARARAQVDRREIVRIDWARGRRVGRRPSNHRSRATINRAVISGPLSLSPVAAAAVGGRDRKTTAMTRQPRAPRDHIFYFHAAAAAAVVVGMRLSHILCYVVINV